MKQLLFTAITLGILSNSYCMENSKEKEFTAKATKELHMAIYETNPHHVYVLLHQRADPNLIIEDLYTGDLVTALIKTAMVMKSLAQQQKIFIASGGSPTLASATYLPNMQSIQKIFNILLEHGADTTLLNNRGQTATDILNSIDDKNLLKKEKGILDSILVALNASKQSPQSKQSKKSKQAKKAKSPQSKQAKEPKQAKKSKNTEKIYKAIKDLNITKVRKLLKKANINATDQNGNTPLNIAASMVISVCTMEKYKHYHNGLESLYTIIDELLKYNADKYIKNKAGKTALDKLKAFQQEEGHLISPQNQQEFNSILLLLSQPKQRTQKEKSQQNAKPTVQQPPKHEPSPSQAAETIAEQAWSQFPEAKKLRNLYQNTLKLYNKIGSAKRLRTQDRDKLRNLYGAVLSIPPYPTKQQIRQAFRKLSLKWHPDKHSGNKELANEVFKIINEANQFFTSLEQ